MLLTNNPDKTVTVDMGAPILESERIPFGLSPRLPVVLNHPIEVMGKTIPVTLVSMGNPHCMIFQDDLPEKLDPAVFGPAIETHPMFPEKTNVEFVTILDEKTIDVVVWERGCGFTLACGTGACATAVASTLCGKTEERAEVRLPGGSLDIHWQRDGSGHVMMTGPATYVFTGQIELPQRVFVSTAIGAA
jgi:diaminopimelate epimerase